VREPDEKVEETRDLLSMGQLETIPIASDRAPGTVIDQVQDAVQEFLTDWLVRRKYEEAMAFLFPSACASVNIDDDSEEDTLEGAEAQKALLENHEIFNTRTRGDA
jgi:hypothetical protein